MTNVISIVSERNNLPHNDELVKMIKSSAGRFFSCTFIKKNGEVRVLNGRIGVHKGVKGVGHKFNKPNLITVFDAKAKEYRMVNVETLQRYSCGRFEWSVK